MNEQKVQRLELDDPEVISARKVSARLEICQCDEKLCSCCQIIASGMRGMGAAAFQSGLLKGAISQTRNIAEELNRNKAKNKKCKLVRPFLMRMLGELEQKWKRGDYYELRQEDWKALRSKTAGRNQKSNSGRTEPDERSTGSGEESDGREGDTQPT